MSRCNTLSDADTHNLVHCHSGQSLAMSFMVVTIIIYCVMPVRADLYGFLLVSVALFAFVHACSL